MPTLRQDEDQAADAMQHVRALTGVKYAKFSPATGSLTISYDPVQLCPSRIINTLARRGHLTGIVGFPLQRARRSVAPSASLKAPASPVHQLQGRTADVPTPAGFHLTPTTKIALAVATRLVVPLLLERAFGRAGKLLAATLL